MWNGLKLERDLVRMGGPQPAGEGSTDAKMTSFAILYTRLAWRESIDNV
jgi:hypothetical protein